MCCRASNGRDGSVQMIAAKRCLRAILIKRFNSGWLISRDASIIPTEIQMVSCPFYTLWAMGKPHVGLCLILA